MTALVLSAWHIVGAQQMTDFLPSSPDVPGFIVPTPSVSSFLLLFFLQGVSLPAGVKTHTYTQMSNRDPSTVPHV